MSSGKRDTDHDGYGQFNQNHLGMLKPKDKPIIIEMDYAKLQSQPDRKPESDKKK